MEISFLIFFLFGALGALAKDILHNNSLSLPKKTNGDFSLGFLGGMITGGMAGYFVNAEPVTAFLAGYAGTSVIENLLLQRNKNKIYPVDKNGSKEVPPVESNEMIIRRIAKEESVDPELAVRVARCESALNHLAVNVNREGSRDRGLFQINSRWHPQVTDEQAFDPIFSTRFFCRAFKAGNLRWWNASRHCWEKK